MGEELWYVKLPNGDVHRVTIDQLDGAFQAGHIDESTMVLAAGASQWTKLGEIAGIDGESEATEPPAEPEAQAAPAEEDDDFAYVPRRDANEPLDYVPQVRASEQVDSAPQVSASADDSFDYVPRHDASEPLDYVPQVRASEQLDYVPQVASRVPRQAAYVPQQAAPVAAAPTGYIPQIAPPRAAAPVSYAPPANGTPYSVAVSMKPAPVAPYQPNSLRPMSMDLGDLDLEMPVQRKGRAGRFVGAVVALAAIAGGVGFAAQRAHIGTSGSSDDIANVAAAAAIAAPPPVADPVPPPAPAPPPPVAAPSPSPAANGATAEASPMNPMFTTRLNEGTTKKLLSADKARATKATKGHRASGGGGGSSSHSKSTTFTTGGNKFDPLNSAI